MATSEVVKARNSHVLELCGRLRLADREEVWAAARLEADDALAYSFHASLWCRAVLHGGRTVAIFGVARDPEQIERGSPWLLGTDEMDQCRMFMAKHSRRYIWQMLADFAILENWVDARNETSIRWLQWCGFHLEEPLPWGSLQLPFRRFWMRRGGDACAVQP